MHVLIDALGSYSGGARTSLRYLLPRLVAKGVRVTVACREDQRAGFGMGPELAVGWERVPDAVRPLAARLAYSFTAVPVMAKRLGVDVLFCPTDQAPPLAPCAVVMMIRNPTPYVQDVETVEAPARRVREAGMRAVTLASALRSDRVILVSHAALDATAARIPLPLSRVRVVHHGRDGRFCPPQPGQERDTNHVLSVSSIYTFKNYPVLLDALVLLRDREGKTPKVSIAGASFDVAHAAWLKERTVLLGLQSSVEWLGEVPHARLVEMYQRATAFVMPSRLETFGHPYVEAMATGTPALVGDIPCAREMCGDAVLYAHPDQPAAFAQHLAALLSDGDLRRSLAQKGPERAAMFSWDRCANETLQVFEEAVAAHSGHR